MLQFTNTFHLVDSNILVDFFMETKKQPELIKIFNQTIYLNYTIFTETINFIQNKISFKDAFEVAEEIITNPNVFIFLPITPKDLELAVVINQKYYNSKIGFSDSLILAQAENYNLKVLTQDKRMAIYPKVEVENPFLEV